jgi:hypothetical protein
MPKTRALLDGASLGPDALKSVGEAFDEAWAEIASHFGHNVTEVEAARLTLANALLSVADEESRDVKVLKQAALQVMAQNYASLPIEATVKLAREALTESYWRNRAEEAWLLALAVTDPLVKRELTNIAFTYDRISKMEKTAK